VTENQKAIVPVSHELAALGRRPEVKELARRILTQAPAGMKLTPTEALTLAQYSFSLGANPLIGETWLLKKGDRVLGVMPGVRLYRRRADEKDERTDDVRWQEPEIVADADERERLGVPTDARLCIIVRLYRRSQAQAYSALTESLSRAGAPWEDIKHIAGTKPYLTGVGFVSAREPTEGMPDYQRALKRAEAHALKQGYSLPFGFIALADGAEAEVPSGATLDEYVIEGSWKEVATEDNRTPEERHEAAVAGSAALYGDEPTPETIAKVAVHPPEPESVSLSDPTPKNWPANVVERAQTVWVNSGIIPPDSHTKHVVMLLNLLDLPLNVSDEVLVSVGKTYRAERDQGADSKRAAAVARIVVATPF